MGPVCEVLQGIFRLIKGENPVYYGVYLVLVVKAKHLLESVFGSVQYALEGDVTLQSQNVGMESALRSILLAG